MADQGGEIRFYVRQAGEGIAVTRAERVDDEVLQIVVSQVDDAIRFLTVELGWDIRARQGLSLTNLFLPMSVSQLADGASLEKGIRGDESGQASLGLIVGGSVRAMFRDVPEPRRAVEFSHYADAPISLIRESFLDPVGAPLFFDPLGVPTKLN